MRAYFSIAFLHALFSRFLPVTPFEGVLFFYAERLWLNTGLERGTREDCLGLFLLGDLLSFERLNLMFTFIDFPSSLSDFLVFDLEFFC